MLIATIENFRQAGEAQGYGFDIAEALSSNVDDKTMHELYLWPFADAVKAGAGSVMCSYQQVSQERIAVCLSRPINMVLLDQQQLWLPKLIPAQRSPEGGTWLPRICSQ